MSAVSQRDVVFTPFMLRVRATVDGEDTWVPPQLRPSQVQPVAAATDAWFSLRARSEQVIAEANAMLTGRPLVDLDDEFGTGELAFVLRYGRQSVRVSMGQRERQAWVELRQSGQPRPAGPVEPVDLSVLEDLIIDMLWNERRNSDG